MASIVFDETEIVLNPTCALFVTMEAPRAIKRKIPDNFKVTDPSFYRDFLRCYQLTQVIFRCFSEASPCRVLTRR